MPNSKIIFFDGICGLCNKAVDFLLRHDSKQRLKFSPLQGQTAAMLIPKSAQKMDTFVYWTAGKSYQKSTAILRALSDIGGLWKLTSILLLIPAFMRNAVYSWVSKHRYDWFGKNENCRVPTACERTQFLD
ncbi:MAG: putative DCC family thiol-disulfide oxidoreductase YuxK [Litorivivens sp.]|jgi:predicted DCC family thiol-disulfide oxidoreductase YuxK